MKKALITGANGQDASFLAELLVSKGYEVYGTIRRNSVPESQTTRIQTLHNNSSIKLMYADLLDEISINNTIEKTKPDEIYHLAAQSHVRISFDLPNYTLQTNVIGTSNIINAAKKYCPNSKIYNAASSEMFGNSCDGDGFQRETTRMIPVSPYGCSKLCAYNLCHNYRNSYNMFICSGILFNHESHRRGINFVTNKIVHDSVSISKNKKEKLYLGNLNAKRDWGHAKDYVYAMWLMLQNKEPKDYVVATGVCNTVQYVVDYVFEKLNLNKEKHLEISEKLYRPEELNYLRGDSSLIRKELGWSNKYSLTTMLDEMIDYWCKKIEA